uniref:PCI domain-containing protein n=1 Tax=Tetranychus urticae TaxID=32264 RepID=T1K4K9_TETUR
MVHGICQQLRKTKGPSFADKIGYPSTFKLETPRQLFLSMEWILNHLIDKFDDEKIDKCEWYDFIWTTFRLIRRKITQFELDDLDAVHMLEVFTRFHIFSAHNMSEFTSSGFVEHLNFENLGKCLITLNHFYDDFSRRSIHCENEAEFRAYFLLYFSRSDIVMTVTRFDPVIRKSSAVQFAVKCLSAIDSNNYIVFFKMVQKADFLTSCMLHRYFYEVRKKSFQIMSKAFIRSSESLKYRKSGLKKLLAFEDEDELNEFCNHIGIEADEQSVIFSKKNLIEKEIPPNRRISNQLIEYKRKSQSLSKIIGKKKA